MSEFDARRQCLITCGNQTEACKAGDPGAFATDRTGTEPAPSRSPPKIPKLSDIPKQNPDHHEACGKPFLACQGVCNDAYAAARAAKVPFENPPPLPTECYAACASLLAKCSERTPPKLWPKASDQQDQEWGSCRDSAAACFLGCDGTIDYDCRSGFDYYDKFRSRCRAAEDKTRSCRSSCANTLKSCQQRVAEGVTEWSPDGPAGAAGDGGDQGGDVGCLALRPTPLGTIIVPAAGNAQCGNPCPPLAGWQLPAGARCGASASPAGASTPPAASPPCPDGQHWSKDLGRCHAN